MAGRKTGGSACRFSSYFQKDDKGLARVVNNQTWRLHMILKQTLTMASLALAVALSFAMSSPAAADKKLENTVGGAVVGAGVGYLVGGKKGATGGAVVGAIAGNRKKR